MRHGLTSQREYFAGAERLQQVWALAKQDHAAVCEVWSHQFGYELRLTIAGDELPRTQVCRSTEQLVQVQEEWRTALERKGWAKATGE